MIITWHATVSTSRKEICAAYRRYQGLPSAPPVTHKTTTRAAIQPSMGSRSREKFYFVKNDLL